MDKSQIVLFVVCNIFLLPGIFFGIFLCRGKGKDGDSIAGYNTASPAERAKYNEKALCRGVGVLLLIMVGCMELVMIGDLINNALLQRAGGILLVLASIGGLVFINMSKRFKKK